MNDYYDLDKLFSTYSVDLSINKLMSVLSLALVQKAKKQTKQN